jgi:hypothetical protein
MVAAVVATALFGLTLLAAGPFSGSWSNQVLVQTGPVLFKSIDSILHLDYSFGSLVATSESEVYLTGGFVWQGFGMSGRLGAFDLQTDLLFGPSTSDFIYAQAIVTTSIAGVDLGLYYAQLSDAVLGGPASGVALRLAGSMGEIDVVSVTEFGARIQDDDVDGITIYHTATGLYKGYITNPLVPVASDSSCETGGNKGFTGEKLSVSGWSFGCVADIGTTLYMTQDGFDSFTVDLAGIDAGISWLTFDFQLVFALQTKSWSITPTFVVGEAICIDTYFEVLTDAPDHTLYDSFTSITGVGLYGLGLVCSWDGVTVKDLTVLDTGSYAITTPEYGSVIEEIVTALEEGHAVYSDYWELLSIEVTGGNECCGGQFSFLVNTYFSKTATSLFGWGMTYVEAKIPFGSTLAFSGSFEVLPAPTGLAHIGFGIEVTW